ncbi:putative membrane-anchored protein [Kerstersia gyiorum]|nr:putative membrane-anchored protein [Kerstersia gyiorum]
MIVWVLLTIVTLGLAMFVFPYYMQKFIISKTYAYDAQGQRVGRLVCTIDLASIIGNIVLWAIISIVTLGLGYLVFLYKISAHCMSHTKLVGVNDL